MLIAAGAATMVIVLASCGPKAPAGSQGTQGTEPRAGRFGGISVQVAAAVQGSLEASHQTAGSVVPVTQSAVAAQVSGVVARIVHQPGDWVKAGDVVVQLDPSQFSLAVQNAQAAVKNAQINLAIGQDNVAQAGPRLQANLVAAQSALAAAQKGVDAVTAEVTAGGSSASSLDNAQSQHQQAQAAYDAAQTAVEQNGKAAEQTLAQLQLAVEQATIQLQQAQLNLANAAIKAPFYGQLVAMSVNPGEFVNANTATFTLASSNRKLQFSVPPSDAPSLRSGLKVRFTTMGASSDALVDQAPSAPVNGVVPLTATIVGGVQPAFGVVGAVSYTLPLASGVLVPIASLQTNGSDNYVSVVSGGKVTNLVVTVVAETDTQAVVTGVPAGAQVIVSPPPGLLPGSAVQAVAATPSAGRQAAVAPEVVPAQGGKP